MVVPLSRFRGSLARPRGAALVDALISTPDTEGAVAALSVPELYFLIKEVGFNDTTELIAFATPDQIRGCLDLDLWDRDHLQDEAVRPWLAGLIEAGYEKLGEVWSNLDSELSALLLSRWTRVYDLSVEEEPPPDSDLPIYTTPDTFFAVEILAEDETDSRMTMQLLEDLYRSDLIAARHMLMASRTEPPAELEEMSYRWRTGRMADLGYVDFYDALEVFRPLDPASITIDENSADTVGAIADGDEARVPRNLPAIMADAVAGQSFLARALERVVDADQEQRLETAIVYLVNHVLSASRVSPGDAEAAQAGAEHSIATLSLGLETVSGGDLDRAAAALQSVSLIRLHRAGFTATLRLGRLARAIAPRAASAAYEDRVLMTALLRARPFLPDGGGLRAFGSVADVRMAAERLTRLALRIAIAQEALGVDLLGLAELPEPRPDLDDFVRTALARALAGGQATAEPLGNDEIPKNFGPVPRESATLALIARLDDAGVIGGREYLNDLIDSWLYELEQTLGALTGDPDPRFVTGVLLRITRD